MYQIPTCCVCICLLSIFVSSSMGSMSWKVVWDYEQIYDVVIWGINCYETRSPLHLLGNIYIHLPEQSYLKRVICVSVVGFVLFDASMTKLWLALTFLSLTLRECRVTPLVLLHLLQQKPLPKRRLSSSVRYKSGVQRKSRVITSVSLFRSKIVLLVLGLCKVIVRIVPSVDGHDGELHSPKRMSHQAPARLPSILISDPIRIQSLTNSISCP